MNRRFTCFFFGIYVACSPLFLDTQASYRCDAMWQRMGLAVLAVINIPQGRSQAEGFFEAQGGVGDDVLHAFFGTSGGNYGRAGSTDSVGMGDLDVLLTYYDDDGIPIRSYTYGSQEQEEALFRMQAYDDTSWLTGYTNTMLGAGGYDVLWMQLDDEGKPLLQQSMGAPDDEKGYAEAMIPDGAKSSSDTVIQA